MFICSALALLCPGMCEAVRQTLPHTKDVTVNFNCMLIRFWAWVCSWLFAFLSTGVGGLRDVAVKVPVAVSPGDTVTLQCSYDLEGDPLYTVKWYKGRQEFFRYVPKELPHTRVFPLPGVNVDVSMNTWSNLFWYAWSLICIMMMIVQNWSSNMNVHDFLTY